MEKNDCENYVNTLPDDTRKIMLRAMDTYRERYENKDNIDMYVDFLLSKNRSLRKKLTKNDKICVSLFLAILSIDTETTRILNAHNISYANVEIFFDNKTNTSQENVILIDNKTGNDSMTPNLEVDFITLIEKIRNMPFIWEDSDIIKLFSKKFMPQHLFFGLIDENFCDSNIMDCFFACDIEQSILEELESSAEKRIKAEYRIKTEYSEEKIEPFTNPACTTSKEEYGVNESFEDIEKGYGISCPHFYKHSPGTCPNPEKPVCMAWKSLSNIPNLLPNYTPEEASAISKLVFGFYMKRLKNKYQR